MKKHILVTKGEEYFNSFHRDGLVFIPNDLEANEMVVDIDHYPHAFVLSCCMDRQMNAEKAWSVPVRIMELLGDTSIETLAGISLSKYRDIFTNNSLHRYPGKMAEVFYYAVHRIMDEYKGDASRIWTNNPSSAIIVSRFLEFYGVGPKIATMATNILARDFHIPMSDYIGIDVSVDVHVRRVMERMGLISEGCSNDQIRYVARELSPSYPGIIDEPLWQIGREYCHPSVPDCSRCVVSSSCLFCKNKGKDKCGQWEYSSTI